MRNEIFAVFDIEGFGQAGTLRVEDVAGGSGRLIDPSIGFDREFLDSVMAAKLYAMCLLGWPKHCDFLWSPILRGDLPGITEGSMFGALAMVLMRSVVDLSSARRSSDRHQTDRWPVPLVRAVTLNRVAVSAKFDPNTGGFGAVGAMEQKLKELTALGHDSVAVVVVAEDQVIALPTETRKGPWGLYHIVSVDAVNPTRRLPVLKACDPVDAFEQLCALQAHALSEI
jgi:hypothetical protein